MLNRLTGVLAPLAMILFSGCSHRDPLGCTQNADCPNGHVCLSETCEQLCATDEECSAGNFCNGEICIPGHRDSPLISGLTGNGSSTACQADTSNNCLGTGIVVTGKNLGGSRFRLVSELPSGPQYDLEPLAGGRVQDAVVDLTPAIAGPTLVPGRYVLTATNAAGSDQAGVELLKGDPGEITNLTGDAAIAAINADDTTTLIRADRVAGGGSSGGGTRYIYDNDTTAQTESLAGDRMVVRLDASASGVQSLAIDSARFDALCGDIDGCTLRLAVNGWQGIEAPLVGAPCHFQMTATRSWTVSHACTQWYGTWGDNAGTPQWATPPLFYAPYRSAMWGIDGGNDDGAGGHFTGVVLHNFACYLSEAAPTGSTAGFAEDDTEGFYLIASHGTWAGSYYPTSEWPTADSGRGCLLIVDD